MYDRACLWHDGEYLSIPVYPPRVRQNLVDQSTTQDDTPCHCCAAPLISWSPIIDTYCIYGNVKQGLCFSSMITKKQFVKKNMWILEKKVIKTLSLTYGKRITLMVYRKAYLRGYMGLCTFSSYHDCLVLQTLYLHIQAQVYIITHRQI